MKELERLEQLRLQGATAAAIATELGRTLASVKCRLAQDEIPSTWRLAARWLAVLNQRHTIAGAAAALGLSKWAVKQAKRKLRRAGFDIPAALRGNDHGDEDE